MIYITDEHGISVESRRDGDEKTVIARALLRRINSLLRDVYNPQANMVKRTLDALLRDIDRDRY